MDLGIKGRKALAIGLRVKSGAAQISDVTKNGSSVMATVRVKDATGKTVSAVTKPLKDLGFG